MKPTARTVATAALLAGAASATAVLGLAAPAAAHIVVTPENAAAGGPEEVVERLHAYARAGADRCYLQIRDFDDLDHLALVAEQVLPFV